jgi:hypothetical protein
VKSEGFLIGGSSVLKGNFLSGRKFRQSASQMRQSAKYQSETAGFTDLFLAKSKKLRLV